MGGHPDLRAAVAASSLPPGHHQPPFDVGLCTQEGGFA